MLNIAKLFGAAAAVLSIGIAAPAVAESTGGNYVSISAEQVGKMLTEFEIAYQMRASQSEGGSPVVLAETGGGGRFLITFQNCVDSANSAGCTQATLSTAQSSAGVAFEDLNVFNSNSTVTRVVYEQSQQLLIFGRNIVMPGGVGKDNFKLQIALFLQDMSLFTKGRAAGTSVSFGVTPSLRGKIDSLDASASRPVVRAKNDFALELEMAIENATGVNFDIENSPLE